MYNTSVGTRHSRESQHQTMKVLRELSQALECSRNINFRGSYSILEILANEQKEFGIWKFSIGLVCSQTHRNQHAEAWAQAEYGSVSTRTVYSALGTRSP